MCDCHELGGLEPRRSVQHDQLVEAAVEGALGARAVVADDVVDDRVVEDAEVVDGVDETADVVVGVLEEAGVDLHLAGEHRLQLGRHVVPGRDLVVPGRELSVGRDHAKCLLSSERLLTERVPPLVELALVLR